MEGALRLLASGGALEQMLQACEQGMSATDEALSDLRGVGRPTGKRKGGDELAHQPVRHSLYIHCGSKTRLRPSMRCCLVAWMARWRHRNRGR